MVAAKINGRTVIAPVVVRAFYADGKTLGKHALGKYSLAACPGDFAGVELALAVFLWQAILVQHWAGQSAPADALHRQGRDHLVVRIAIQGHASHGRVPHAITVNIVLRLEWVVRAAHGLVDFFGWPLCGAPLADEGKEGRQRVDARRSRLAARAAIGRFQVRRRPVLRHIVFHHAVGWIAQHVIVGNARPQPALGVSHLGQPLAQEGRCHADHIALAMTDDGDRHVGLFLPDGLDQPGQAVGGQHEIRAWRAGVHLPVIGRVHVLDLHPQEQLVRQAFAPQVRQRSAAIGERSAAPVVLFVQEYAVAIRLQLDIIGCIAPAKADHGRIAIAFHEGSGFHQRVNETVARQLFQIAGRRHGNAFLGATPGIVYAPMQARIQSRAQTGFRLVIPFAIGIHAMHEDHDAWQGQARGNRQRVMVEAQQAVFFAYLQVFAFIEGQGTRLGLVYAHA